MTPSNIGLLLDHKDFLAVNKPAGILSIPDRYNKELPSVFSLLAGQTNEIFVVHRIDRDTSGVLCFAKNPESHKFLNDQFAERKIKKEYRCIVEGNPSSDEFISDAPLRQQAAHPGRMEVHPKGKPSLSHFIVLKRFRHFALLAAFPSTGRTHQLRVHLSHAGHPLVADAWYGYRKELTINDIKKNARLDRDGEPPRPLLSRPALHAQKLEFMLFDVLFAIEAPLPKDMHATLAQLEKWDR